MNNEIFLIDANSLITPYLTFYPFDFAPGFWQQLANSIKNGQVAILDVVKAEILRGNDELKQRWTRGYKRYKETSGLIEWKECQIFHSIFT